MKAVVLAAGEGRRLESANLGVPKPMAPIGGRPLLEYTFALLRHYGVREIAINVCHMSEAITSHFGDGSSIGLVLFYLRESALSGTAGAIKQLAEFLGNDPFFVLYGDVLTDIDLSELAAFHERRSPIGTIAICELDSPANRGVVAINENEEIVGFVEKPSVAESSWANGGVYVLHPDILDFVPAGEVVDFGRDVFPSLLADDLTLSAYRVAGYLRDIGEPEQYRQAVVDFESGRFKSYVDW